MRRSHAKKGLSELQLHSSKDRILSLIPGYCSTLMKGQVVTLHPSGPKMLEAESMRGSECSYEPLLTNARSVTRVLFLPHLQVLDKGQNLKYSLHHKMVSKLGRTWRKAKHKNHGLNDWPPAFDGVSTEDAARNSLYSQAGNREYFSSVLYTSFCSANINPSLPNSFRDAGLNNPPSSSISYQASFTGPPALVLQSAPSEQAHTVRLLEGKDKMLPSQPNPASAGTQPSQLEAQTSGDS